LSDLTVLIDRVRGNRVRQQTPAISTAAAQTLICNFSSVSVPQEIRFTAVGSTVGTWVNIATLTFNAADSPKTAQAPVTVVSLQAFF
jgi:hypothetical protein